MNLRYTATLAVALAACIWLHGSPRPMSAEKNGSRIDIKAGKRFVTSYHFSPDEKYPYFFPVNSPLSGSGVTSMRNGTYPHHSSLFFGCDKVNGGNYWQENLERGRIVSLGPALIHASGEAIVIRDECMWKRPDAEAPIRDLRTITVCAPSDSLYQIDFDITLEFLTDVIILKTNHSLFSARIDPDLSVREGGTMVNAEGALGEKETFGRPSPWLDCHATRKSGTEGIALLQHPSNPGFPSPWFTRDYGFISPTPMYWPTDGKSTRFRQNERIRLRYRVLIHTGNEKEANIAEAFERYKHE